MGNLTLNDLKKELEGIQDPDRAKNLARYFKTGKGEYGEGDVFVGLTVPQVRVVAKKYYDLEFKGIETLLKSKIHEQRLIALFILTNQFEKNFEKREEIFKFYLNHKKHINNWDLIDLSAYKIVGAYLTDKDKSVLYELAGSNILWDRRIAVLSTFYFIKYKEYDDALKIAEVLINDKEDLIQKAVGWMLREIGKRDLKAEKGFLAKYYKIMSRTMLRYAIEKFPEGERKKYLLGTLS